MQKMGKKIWEFMPKKIVGLFTAVLLAFTNIDNLRAQLPIGAAVLLVLISIVLTLIAGIIPSKSAAKKDPVVALRTE